MTGPNPGPPRPPRTPPRDPPGAPPVGASLTTAPLAPKPSITSIQSAESSSLSPNISAKPSLASLASTKGLLGAPAPIAGFQAPKKHGLEDVPESPASPRQEKKWGSLGAAAGGAPESRAPAAAKTPPQGGTPEKPGYKTRLLRFLVTNVP